MTSPPKPKKAASEGFFAGVSVQIEQWRKKFQQQESPPPPPSPEDLLPPFSDSNECHICHEALNLLKFKHNCRNCGKSVCGNHSKNYLPLPELGVLKEVRVCDVCYQLKVQWRAGARGPPAPPVLSATTSQRMANPLGASLCGILYSGLVEEQDDMLDEMLYLGSLRLGSRSLASRNFNPNIAIWMERMFMLTPAELLCFKPQKEKEEFLLGIGEVRTSIHMTDILHIEIDDDYPRILTVVRSDGRIFRIRTKEPETCSEIYEILQETIQTFQDALFKLQRGLVPEDNKLSSIIRAYCLGPSSVSGVASFSIEDVKSAENVRVLKRCEPSMDELYLSAYLGSKRIDQFKWSAVGVIVLQVVVCGLVYSYGMDYYPRITVTSWSILLLALGNYFGSHFQLIWSNRAIAESYRVEIPQIDCNKQKTKADHRLRDEDVDPRFIVACNDDMEEAKRKFTKYLQWRKENDIDHILQRPHPHFKVIKESYIHLTHKEDKNGHIISIELAGSMKKGMQHFLSLGVVETDVVYHLGFYNEFLWNVIDRRPLPLGTMLKIVDMNGVSLTDFGGDVVSFMKQCSSVGELYYPERLYKVFIVNPPSWFNIIWKAMSPLINPKTRDKINVVKGQKEIQKALLEYIDAENLPVEYGGTCACEGGCLTHSPHEVLLRDYVERLNSGEDCTAYLDRLMYPVIPDTAPPTTKISSRHSATNLSHLADMTNFALGMSHVIKRWSWRMPGSYSRLFASNANKYAWLRQSNGKKLRSFIKSEENKWKSVCKQHHKFQKSLYLEMRDRLNLNELEKSVPERIGDHLYYLKQIPRQNYPVYCRQHAMTKQEEVLLDPNIVDCGQVTAFKVSPDGKYLAYTTDQHGNEQYEAYIKDLRSQKTRLVHDNVRSIEWNMANGLYYTVPDEYYRPCQVYRHQLNNPKKDQLVFIEHDPSVYLDVVLTKDQKFVLINANSKESSEVHALQADDASAMPITLHPREANTHYFADHSGDAFYIVTNANKATNYKVVVLGDNAASSWKDFLPDSDGNAMTKYFFTHIAIVEVKIDDMDLFQNYLVLYERHLGQPRIRVCPLNAPKESHILQLPQEYQCCMISPGINRDYTSNSVRFSLSTPLVPEIVYEYDMNLRTLKALQETHVTPPFDRSQYVCRRIWVDQENGPSVPMTLVHHKDIIADGSNPTLLTAYGAYGANLELGYEVEQISLLERRWVLAFAHVRGGGELGLQWHAQGRKLHKKNTFIDYIACSKYLVAHGITNPTKLVAKGTSAGGLIMGYIANNLPELYGAIVMNVPFVDILSTMQDDTLPLTIHEYDEWGNPNDRATHDYMLSYSPCDNVKPKIEYPPMLLTAAMNDMRVQYWEPIKFTHLIREANPNAELWLRVSEDGGHFGGGGRLDQLQSATLEQTFLHHALKLF
ncbi:serine protease family S09A [Thraustotheca clavata]|uniref:Prolyl endopeptidase-like n=1 Tax=Thraustotheca clavata TaxID=74557 RepID=A0A1V9ZR80_9STRA|nr:serine protease family S09A [Thraustotheca clavata]